MLRLAGESPREVCKEEGELFEEVPTAGYSVLSKGKDPNSWDFLFTRQPGIVIGRFILWL